MSVCPCVTSLFTQKPLEILKNTISMTPLEIHPEVPWAYSIWPPRSLEAIWRPFLISSHRRKQNSGVYNKTKTLHCIKIMKIYLTHFDLWGHLRPLEAIFSSATFKYWACAHFSVHLVKSTSKIQCKTDMKICILLEWFEASIFYSYANQIGGQFYFRFQYCGYPTSGPIKVNFPRWIHAEHFGISCFEPPWVCIDWKWRRFLRAFFSGTFTIFNWCARYQIQDLC